MTALTEAEGSCKTCGLYVYTSWIGDEPPNGACIHGKDGAPKLCHEVLSSIAIARTNRSAGIKLTDRNRYCETLQKALGITDAELDAWRAKQAEDKNYD
jgi:hypothetical protein